MSLLKKPIVSTTLQKALVRNFEAPKLMPKLKDRVVLPTLPEFYEPNIDPGVPKFYYINPSYDKYINFPFVPLLSESNRQACNEILIKKLEICNSRCDFTQTDTLGVISIKTHAFEELIQFLESENFTDLLYPNVRAKIIDLIHSQPTYPPYDFNESAWNERGIIRFSNWPHLYLFYTFLFRYIQQFGKQISFSYKSMAKFSTLLQSPDERESKEVLEIIFKYLSIFPQNIEKMLSILLDMLIDSTDNLKMIYCQQPILKIFIKLCARYSNFFKDNKNKIFSAIYMISIPSHNSDNFGSLVLFLEKFFDINPDMLMHFALKAVRNFPLTSLIDQILHVTMCNHIFERLDSMQIGILSPYIASITTALCESNSQKILASAFSIWTNPKIKRKLGDHAMKLYPAIYRSLSAIIQDPKRVKLKGNTLVVLKSMQELNPRVFESLHSTLFRSQTHHSFEPVKTGWMSIINTAKLRCPEDSQKFEETYRKYINIIVSLK